MQPSLSGSSSAGLPSLVKVRIPSQKVLFSSSGASLFADFASEDEAQDQQWIESGPRTGGGTRAMQDGLCRAAPAN